MLVFADADLDRAVAGALWGSFSNCGQVCSAVERIYVEQPLQEAFVEELVRRTRQLRLGRGDELETELGPLVAEERRAHVEELVADAVGRGAELRTGGRRADVGLPGWFYEPTVLSAVDTRGADRARRDLRAGGDGRAVPRRGRGGAAGERLELRARRERLDARPRARAAAGAAASRPARSGRTTSPTPTAPARPRGAGRKESGFGRTHSQARALRALAREVRRPRPRPRARSVVVPVRPGRAGRLRAACSSCSTATASRASSARRGSTAAGSCGSDGGTFPGRERAFPRGRGRRGPDGGRRRQAALAPARRGAGVVRVAPETVAQLALAAEGRRARRPPSSRGSWRRSGRAS